MIGTTVGSYRITHELGSGGMGVVYAAEHVVLKSKAAVKVLQPKHSTDKEVVTRFFNEARAATRIRHPGIVQVFDFGNHESGSAYLVMELLEGETLAQRIKRTGKMGWRQALVVARQTAGALEAAHRAGIVHRDLKPHNLFLVHDPDLPGGERVKVLDFGIAKLASPGGGGVNDDTTGHTREGALLGTPKYMSPEQCRGAARVDGRADVYSLGCVLYAMICGEPPFSGEGSGEVMAKQIYEPPPLPSLHAPDLDDAVEELVLECLEKDPGDRPATMHELGDSLDTLLGRTAAGPSAAARRAAGSAAALAASTLTATSTSLGGARGPRDPSSASADSAPEPSSGHITTLGASAAQIGGAAPSTSGSTSLRAKRSWRALAAVVGAGLLASGGLYVARGGLSGADRTSGAADRDAGVALAVHEVPPPVPAPAPAPGAIVDAATAPSLPGVTRVKLHITSRPSGAAVVRVADGEWLGQTPVTLSVPAAEGQVDLRVRLRGYVDQDISFHTDEDGERDVLLVADRGATRPKSGTKPRPPAAAAPAPEPSAPPAAPAGPKTHPILDGTLDPFGDSAAAPDAAR